MAEPLPAPRTRPGHRPGRAPRAVLLLGAILAVVLGGLFISRPALAAPAAPAARAAAAAPANPAAPARSAATAAAAKPPAPAAPAQPAAPAAPAQPGAPFATNQLNALTGVAAPDGGICSVPGVGDIGGLLGLCKTGSGVIGDLNNICSPGPPQPEQATAGINQMISVPGGPTVGKTLYDNYGMAGQFWGATGLQCSDMTSLIGNNVAGMVFDMAKSLDRVTITVYQSAAGANILSWLSNSVNTLITSLGKAIYFPFLAPMVIIGAIWLAWQGLVRKRATRTIEGTLWMVVACAAAIWLIGRPADFTGIGTSVSNGVTQVLNTAFAKLPATAGSNCLPVTTGDPQSVTGNYAFTSGNGLVDENANELWSVLVCKPWLIGEFGTSVYAQPGTKAAQTNVVNLYGRQLLFAQAIATNEQSTAADITAKQAIYNGIATDLQQTNPAVYSLFQGDQWTTRLEIGFGALFAAVAAGLLVLLIALTLIIMKLGFLLLLVAGPFFLIVGIHPGFGRVIAIRWFEMLVGVLMKQVAIALVLSILLYCYSLIMGTSDTVLPWALKIMMIALVTVAVFIYRKPFQHLFSAVGYGMLARDERAEVNLRQSAWGFRRVTTTAAGAVVPGVAAARWARRTAASATGADGAEAAAGTTGAGSAGDGAAADTPGAAPPMPTADSHVSQRQWPEAGTGAARPAPPLPLPQHGARPSSNGASAGWARGSAAGTAAGTGARARGTAQPPVRSSGSGWPGAGGTVRSGESRSGTSGNDKPPAPPFWARSRRRGK